MNYINSTHVSSTLPSQIYLVRRYYNVAATFVLNKYTAIFQKYVRDLTTRCENVRYDSFSILKKRNIWIKYIIWYNLPHIEWFISIENSCHLHSDSKYILANVATRLLQRLSQISSAKHSSNVEKTLCVSWVGLISHQLTNNIKVCQGRETNIQTYAISFLLIHDSKIYFSPVSNYII